MRAPLPGRHLASAIATALLAAGTTWGQPAIAGLALPGVPIGVALAGVTALFVAAYAGRGESLATVLGAALFGGATFAAGIRLIRPFPIAVFGHTIHERWIGAALVVLLTLFATHWNALLQRRATTESPDRT